MLSDGPVGSWQAVEQLPHLVAMTTGSLPASRRAALPICENTKVDRGRQGPVAVDCPAHAGGGRQRPESSRLMSDADQRASTRSPMSSRLAKNLSSATLATNSSPSPARPSVAFT